MQDQEGRLREIAQELKQVRVGQARVEKERVTVSHYKISQLVTEIHELNLIILNLTCQ